VTTPPAATLPEAAPAQTPDVAATPGEIAPPPAKTFSLPSDPTDLNQWSAWVQEQGIDLGLDAVKVLVLVVVSWLFAHWLSGLIRRHGERSSRLDPTLTIFFATLVRWAILAFAVVAVLGIFGIETTSFAALIAAVGLAISLGFQGTLGQLASGVMLLVFRPFKVGDFVRAGGTSGVVKEIQLFATVIDTFDNRRLIVPNASVFGNTIENVSHHSERRVDVAIGTAYEADLDRTREILTEVAKTLPQALADRDPTIVLDELGASSINWSVRVWVAASDVLVAKDTLLVNAKKALDAAGVGIPFPQLDVHMIGTDAK
jgi:small conductance mechanosensitive channel